ncbi:site-2 protease family protein [Oerskovia sp. Root918]|uniref:site-2 protease family protein n=1 Tax=Oerskovia sp. Root918 TaxID=1736607 RepID=UPI000A445D4E|nr:site-2 protease family protein [Oerskovia sp. Root918]
METTPAPARRAPRDPRLTKGWVIGRVSGAPVILTPSWFLAAAVLTLLFAPTVRSFAPGLGVGIYLVSFVFVLLLFVSVFLHEVAHAVVAKSRGHEVTELAVTIWGGHTAYSGTSRRPLDGILISVVGPLTNLLLAVVCWFAFQAQPTMTVPALLLYAAAFSNAFVGVFNLLPGLPLDGGQILESAVWAVTGSRTRGTIVAGWVGRVMAVGVVVWALGWPLLNGYQVDFFTVAWSALIGAFLWSGAGAAITNGRTREAVAGLTVASLAYPAVAVPVATTVSDAVAAAQRAGAGHVVLTDTLGRPVAYADPGAVAAVPPAQAPLTPVGAVAVGLPPTAQVDVHLAGQAMLDAVASATRDAPLLVVTDAGRVVGLLDVSHVVAALQAARGR